MKKASHSIEISIKRGLDFSYTRSWLKNVVKAVLDAEKIDETVDVDVFITDDRQIHKMNLQYRGIDKPTDVLSFALTEKGADAAGIDFPEGPDEVRNLGEIIISYPRVIEQAGENGVTIDDELTLLITHGSLHLLGYDHENAADSRKMRNREKTIISQIKIKRGEK